jgi:carboxyl-terminal processing protease
MRSHRYKLILVLIPIALLTSYGLFLIANSQFSDLTTTPTPYPAPPQDAPREMKAIWEVWNILVNEHVSRADLNLDELKEAAIDGMLELVEDPYTSYLDPDVFQLQSGNFRGNFEGIGAEVTMRDGFPVIVGPLPNTPAENAGVKAGDVILAIDGIPVRGKPLLESILLIRGPSGTPVTLTLLSLGQTKSVDITIVRGEIPIESVYSTILDETIGYVRLKVFNEDTERTLVEQLDGLEQQGIVGLILDLRNNPGGLVSSTVEVASDFLTEGLVLYEVNGAGTRTDLKVTGAPKYPNLPLVLLVNEFSASGSEVLAGALQDHGRAEIIGSRTFGKGAVNLLRRLSDGGGLNFTFAKWYTPNGRMIEGGGLEPDFLIPSNTKLAYDPQLNKAMDIIRSNVGSIIVEPRT